MTDIPTEIEDLRSEVERLGAENEHLHRAHQAACEGGDLLSAEIKRLTRERDEALEEVERLKQEPELLRAELISLANAARKALADAYDRARKALEAKP